jgi:AraC-like DNA-binding protein
MENRRDDLYSGVSNKLQIVPMEVASVDPLTQLVELLRPRVLLWKHMAGRGDWAWGFPADSGVVFGRVVSGHCRFRLPGGEEQGLEPGDCLLLTEPPAWILRGGAGDAATIALEDLPTDATSPELVRGENNPSQVRVVGGHFEFDSVNKELLTAFLPPVAHIRSRGLGDDGRLAAVLAMIDAEASDVRPGQEAVLSRLLEIVLIELLRTPETLSSHQRGMLAGLTDTQIASALRAFHADIRRNWSVASLSAAASMSRSVFSQRFTALVGQPPMTYALLWRMAVACDALRFSGRSLAEIALATGYGSASAFSTAFTRTVGRSPARFARDSRRVRSERYAEAQSG